jgi:hypothetical protein
VPSESICQVCPPDKSTEATPGRISCSQPIPITAKGGFCHVCHLGHTWQNQLFTAHSIHWRPKARGNFQGICQGNPQTTRAESAFAVVESAESADSASKCACLQGKPRKLHRPLPPLDSQYNTNSFMIFWPSSVQTCAKAMESRSF